MYGYAKGCLVRSAAPAASIFSAIKSRMNLWAFAAIYAAQIALTLPGYAGACKGNLPAALPIYFVHHAIDVFLFWSFLFINKAIEYAAHIGLVAGVAAQWLMNDNQCALTEYMNSLCGKPRDAWLPSLKNMLGLRSVWEYYQFVWLGLLIGWDLRGLGLIRL